MKKIFWILITIASLSAVTSCEDSYFDINSDPNTPQETTPDLRLPSIIAQTMHGYMWAGLRTGILSQQWAYVRNTSTSRYFQMGNWQFQFTSTAYPWQINYYDVGSNIPAMIDEASQEEAFHYMGVGLIMKAMGFGYITDLYGDVPYSESYKGDIFEPKFDTQESIYADLQTSLDKAIEYLNMDQPESAHSLIKGDIMFNGDTDKWIKFAYALKAKLYLHLNKKSSYDPDLVLQNIEKSLSSNDDDADFNMGGDKNNMNSIFSQRRGNVNRMRNTNLYISYLKNSFTGGSNILDPRITVLSRLHTDGTYVGVNVGDQDDQAAPGLFGTFYCPLEDEEDSQTQNAVPFMSYSEVKFIEAEAAFRKGDKPRALSAYQDAIEANMQKLAVAQDDIDTFLSSAAVAQTATALTLSNIMIQKYIALSYSPEVFTDLRRNNYSLDGVYTDMVQPANVYAPLGGKWLRRFAMAYYEISYNINNAKLVGATEEDYPTKEVWWDIAE